jgi:hypothetical protein
MGLCLIGKYIEFTVDNKLLIRINDFSENPAVALTVSAVSGGKIRVQSSGARTPDGSFNYNLDKTRLEMAVSGQSVTGNFISFDTYTKQS